ncbi:MAG TPA: nitroreductase [Caulobacter sp.]|nr:nitroreductase [Caulobacter sp.]
MDVIDAVNRRMSVRAFKPDPVDGAIVRELLEAAARAPSGGNLQPWRVQAVAGEPLEALKATMLQRVASPDPAEYAVYPPNLWEPLRSRRFQVGEDMYASLGIPREDKLARLRWFATNGQGFGAPVQLFFSIDRRCGPPQWSDVGMFMQTFMLLAVERGLDTCPQEFWSHYNQVVHDHVGLPEGHMLFSGMALGYRDETAPVNSWRSRRDPFEAWGELKGF